MLWFSLLTFWVLSFIKKYSVYKHMYEKQNTCNSHVNWGACKVYLHIKCIKCGNIGDLYCRQDGSSFQICSPVQKLWKSWCLKWSQLDALCSKVHQCKKIHLPWLWSYTSWKFSPIDIVTHTAFLIGIDSMPSSITHLGYLWLYQDG